MPRFSATRLLPDIACSTVAWGGVRHVVTLLVRDEGSTTIYTATLGFNGLRVDDPPLE